MQIEGWKYYNHAALPTCAPNEKVNIDAVQNKTIWHLDGGFLLLARWTTDYDCGYETNWWYIIKEAPFNMEEFSSKRRRKIRNAIIKNDVVKIDPVENCRELYKLYRAAYSKYEKAFAPLGYEDFEKMCKKDKSEGADYWAGISKGEKCITGFMAVHIYEGYVETSVAKYHPDYLKDRVSDAIHYKVLDYYLNEKKYKYLLSGERSVNHTTNVQQYNIDSFGYRKAYCKLHMEFNPLIKPFVRMIYPFRKILLKYDAIKIAHQLNSILRMEEICRKEECI